MPQLSEALQLKLAGLVPEGYDAANARLVIASGTCAPLEGLTAEEEATLAEVAKGPKKIIDGRPTLMRVVAWMAHEGVNKNRDAFVKEELAVAATKITPRNPLVMDWNHSAVLGGQDRVIGVWTKAEYAFDQKAKGGVGAWGMMVEGVMFAWLFPDLADAMLADQSRSGAVRFSMACIPASVEFANDAQGMYSVLHNPVFFTNSALDVPAGDPDAIGVGKEAADGPDAEHGLRQQLMAHLNTTTALAERIATLVAEKLAATGEHMPKTKTAEELIAEQAAADAAAAQAAADAAAAEAAAAEAAAAEAAAAEAAAAEAAAAEAAAAEAAAAAAAEAAAAELAAKSVEEQLATLSARLTEVETANVALRAENERLAGENETMHTELAAITAAREAAEAVAAEAALVAKLAARLEQLPETYFTAHSALDVEQRKSIEARWMALDDAAWAEKVADLEKAAPKSVMRAGSYLERSQRAGRLPAGNAAQTQSIADRVRNFTRA